MERTASANVTSASAAVPAPPGHLAGLPDATVTPSALSKGGHARAELEEAAPQAAPNGAASGTSTGAYALPSRAFFVDAPVDLELLRKLAAPTVAKDAAYGDPQSWLGKVAERERERAAAAAAELLNWEAAKEAAMTAAGGAPPAGPGGAAAAGAAVAAAPDGAPPPAPPVPADLTALMCGRLALPALQQLTQPPGLAVFCSSTVRCGAGTPAYCMFKWLWERAPSIV